MNFNTESAAVDLSGYTDFSFTAQLTVDANPAIMDGTVLTLPPFGVAVLTK